uniref:Sodium transporter HKT1-like n=1 Tax=Tanacetum cinerariifolium TaxID=118510 RepID=A0A6L2J062_TANCI|nr:sodium transporter HKT1-like [Tanacetum cinerariifolium]
MSTVEMEVFSNDQLVILTILMFIGGEVFTSMFVLYIRKFFLKVSPEEGNKVDPSMSYLKPHSNFMNKTELAILECGSNAKSEVFSCETVSTTDVNMEDLKFKSFNFLGLVVLFYLVFVQFLGVVSVLIYINVISSSKMILMRKGLHTLTFSIFTIVSTFANCGFVPTNENMLPFRKNAGLLLILIPQVLLGNTLYPPALRFSIWAIGKFTKKRETVYLLENSRVLGYHQLLPSLHSSLLTITVLGFIMVQFILFSSMEWSSGSLSDMNVYQKRVGILFQTVNTRHTGESIVDLSTISAAVLVLFVVMMYLPPYTSFLPVAEESCEQGSKSKGIESLKFSQLSYLVIFIILVCITERKQMVQDPLNFNVLSIVVEVISAYGNVGFSTGYSCDRQLRQDASCENKWYGFSGKWSDEGKLILIVVMIFVYPVLARAQHADSSNVNGSYARSAENKASEAPEIPKILIGLDQLLRNLFPGEPNHGNDFIFQRTTTGSWFQEEVVERRIRVTLMFRLVLLRNINFLRLIFGLDANVLNDADFDIWLPLASVNEELNKLTVKNRYPLPIIDDLFDQLQVAPIQLTEEPEHLLSMRYEHLSITPETESDEVIESNAENLLPIPSKCEEEIDIVTETDDVLPLSIENFADDPNGDIRFLEELLIDDSILSDELSNANFEENPLIPRPPPKPPDVETDAGEEIAVVKEYQEKDKIRSKPDKNRKRGEAGKRLKQLQWIKREKPKKTQKEWSKTQTRSQVIQVLKKERKERDRF